MYLTQSVLPTWIADRGRHYGSLGYLTYISMLAGCVALGAPGCTGASVPAEPEVTEVTQALSGTNLARSVTTIHIDSSYGVDYEGDKAQDGIVSAASKWTSADTAPPHWISYDLGAHMNVSGFIVRHAGAAGEPSYFNTQAFQIQSASSMSGPWSDEFIVSNVAQASVSTLGYASSKWLRYVRLLITDPGIDQIARISEFEVWGAAPTTFGGVNLARTSTAVTTDSNYGSTYQGDKAKDGIISGASKWTSADVLPPHWIAYDLGANMNVNGIIVRHAGAAGEPSYFNTQLFKIQSGTSISGPWTNVLAADNTVPNAASTALAFGAPTSMRYLRLRITDPGADNIARIPEFEVWGTSGSAPASCFVTRNGGDFALKGGTFKFIGVNLRGIAFHSNSEIDTQLANARDMGVKVVRIFIAKNNLNATQVGDKLANFLARVSAVAPAMKVLVALTDFYGTTYYPDQPQSRLSVQGDDGYYTGEGGTLAPSWFTSGYTTSYKPFATALVTRFKSDDRIFAWELGNELKAGNATDMLNFAYTMGWAIRNAGVQQMVSTGFMGVWHACNAPVDTTLHLGQMYVGPWSSWSSSPFHFGSIHTYNNEQSPTNQYGVYQRQDLDIGWFMANGFPYIVGEGGFNGAITTSCPYPLFTGATWDGVPIPSGVTDRGGAVSATINRYFDVKSADGYMQWGFVAGGVDIGEGDSCSGMDSYSHSDWNSLWNVYSAKASGLPSGGASCGP